MTENTQQNVGDRFLRLKFKFVDNFLNVSLLVVLFRIFLLNHFGGFF